MADVDRSSETWRHGHALGLKEADRILNEQSVNADDGFRENSRPTMPTASLRARSNIVSASKPDMAGVEGVR